MHTNWSIAIFISTDIMLARLEHRSPGRARVPPERLKKFEQGKRVCYSVTRQEYPGRNRNLPIKCYRESVGIPTQYLSISRPLLS